MLIADELWSKKFVVVVYKVFILSGKHHLFVSATIPLHMQVLG
jgi:hypothetical protein